MAGLADLLGRTYQEILLLDGLEALSGYEPYKSDDRTYLSRHEVGISLMLTDGLTLSAVFLHSSGHQRFAEFTQQLPSGLKFDMSRSTVRKLLGNPDLHGDTSKVPVLGEMPAWDAFMDGKIKLHVEYSFDCRSIRMVTLSLNQ